MERRKFIVYMTTASGLLPLALTQIACQSSTRPSDDGYSFTSSTDSGHSHSVSINKQYVSQPPISPKSFTTDGSHTHTISITEAQFRLLQDGEEIIIATSEDGGHIHTFTMQIASGGNVGGAGGGDY